ncbi:HAD family hydrolase [Oricola thermophila]|uniref:HAD family hydrolase n=1 Tax=Oricola thermophila TaxID=2742145 RepID=A0A6N1VKN3_9HYPH|nr:HAD family hydrolase [Oricola thermophila]QKV19759.1 HAD family hydrolase [Oricola thermophila]
MAPPELVIFDCDGVLVDTESLANQRLAEILTAHGLPVSMEESRKRFMGRTMKSVRDMVLAENGIDLGEDFAERWLAELPSIFADGVEPIPHVREVLLYLRAIDTPYCVASSAKIEKMHLTLGASGLLPLVEDVLFSAWMVERGKPAPDLFLHAASTLGFEPERCAVIEDSVPGAEAGKAAGMRVFGYAADPLTDREGLAKAGARVFDDMRELPALMGFH